MEGVQEMEGHQSVMEGVQEMEGHQSVMEGVQEMEGHQSVMEGVQEMEGHQIAMEGVQEMEGRSGGGPQAGLCTQLPTPAVLSSTQLRAPRRCPPAERCRCHTQSTPRTTVLYRCRSSGLVHCWGDMCRH